MVIENQGYSCSVRMYALGGFKYLGWSITSFLCWKSLNTGRELTSRPQLLHCELVPQPPVIQQFLFLLHVFLWIMVVQPTSNSYSNSFGCPAKLGRISARLIHINDSHKRCFGEPWRTLPSSPRITPNPLVAGCYLDVWRKGLKNVINHKAAGESWPAKLGSCFLILSAKQSPGS